MLEIRNRFRRIFIPPVSPLHPVVELEIFPRNLRESLGKILKKKQLIKQKIVEEVK